MPPALHPSGEPSAPPRVSVVMPLFDAGAHVGQALASIAAQSMTDWETIVVDDGSRDDGPAIVADLARTDPRIRLITLPTNRGAATARNVATEAARGRYITFLDADDLWAPDKLERQLDFAATNGHVFTHTWYRRIDATGAVRGRTITAPARTTYRRALRANTIGCLTAMYEAAAIGKVYAPDLRKRNDYAIWLTILRQGHAAHCLPLPLAYYRVSKGSLSHRKIDLIRYHYQLFRDVEKLSPTASACLVACNIAARILRG